MHPLKLGKDNRIVGQVAVAIIQHLVRTGEMKVINQQQYNAITPLQTKRILSHVDSIPVVMLNVGIANLTSLQI